MAWSSSVDEMSSSYMTDKSSQKCHSNHGNSRRVGDGDGHGDGQTHGQQTLQSLLHAIGADMCELDSVIQVHSVLDEICERVDVQCIDDAHQAALEAIASVNGDMHALDDSVSRTHSQYEELCEKSQTRMKVMRERETQCHKELLRVEGQISAERHNWMKIRRFLRQICLRMGKPTEQVLCDCSLLQNISHFLPMQDLKSLSKVHIVCFYPA